QVPGGPLSLGVRHPCLTVRQGCLTYRTPTYSKSQSPWPFELLKIPTAKANRLVPILQFQHECRIRWNRFFQESPHAIPATKRCGHSPLAIGKSSRHFSAFRQVHRAAELGSERLRIDALGRRQDGDEIAPGSVQKYGLDHFIAGDAQVIGAAL